MCGLWQFLDTICQNEEEKANDNCHEIMTRSTIIIELIIDNTLMINCVLLYQYLKLYFTSIQGSMYVEHVSQILIVQVSLQHSKYIRHVRVYSKIVYSRKQTKLFIFVCTAILKIYNSFYLPFPVVCKSHLSWFKCIYCATCII